MNNNELFIEKYKLLEDYIRAEFNLSKNESPIVYLLNEFPREYRYVKEELNYCREIRNLLQHKPKVGNQYVVEASTESIQLLEDTLYKVKNPEIARNRMIPISKVLWKSMDDLVIPTMQQMDANTYTHVPILKDGVVIGVFSENTILSYLVDEQIGFDDNMTFAEISNYLPIGKHRAETFRFTSKNEFLTRITDEFENALKKQDRIGMVFVTENGREEESLLGILTAWDVAAY